MLFYDPVERVVATLHPNHTWEKVVFDPWKQATYDVNDTVLKPTARPTRSRSGRDGILRASAGRGLSAAPGTSSASRCAASDPEQSGSGQGRGSPPNADRRPPRCPGPGLPHHRAQQVLTASNAARSSSEEYTDPRRPRHRGQPARGARRRRCRTTTRWAASSCATTTTCSATASTRPAWRPVSAGC